MRRTSSSARRTASFGSSISLRSSGTTSATEFNCSRTAVRSCPTTSCRSRAIPTRSASWAASTRRALPRRSVSSRSSIWLNARTTWPTSSFLSTCSRCPGRSRSTVCIRRAKCPSGESTRRNRTAFAATVTANPATISRTSAGVGGACSVTGVTTSNTAISPRRPALTAKMRQKRETVRASIRPTLARSSTQRDRPAQVG